MMQSGAGTKPRAGRPRVCVNPEDVNRMRSHGASWRQIAKALGIGTATAMRLVRFNDEARPNTQDMGPKTADQLI